MKTEILNVRELDAEADANLRRAGDCIRQGGLVVFPTETVYGLGADATNAVAAEHIYQAKGRPSDNPLIVHIADPADAALFTYTNPMYERLAERFMPGPLTVVLPARETIPTKTRGGLPTVAIRCPSHPAAHRLIRYAGVPIAAPSANLSGSPSPTNAPHVIDDMNGRVDMILDGGDSEFGLESTIVKIEENQSLTLLRPGRITLEDLKSVTENVSVSPAVTAKLQEGQIAESPGMKYRHYAPKAPVFLLDGTAAQAVSYIFSHASGDCAVIAYHEDMLRFQSALPSVRLYDFGCRDDCLAQAHALFYILREADKKEYRAIYAPLPSQSGVGLALYNRMIRAAAYQIITL